VHQNVLNHDTGNNESPQMHRVRNEDCGSGYGRWPDPRG
jgi:hypothetical protein